MKYIYEYENGAETGSRAEADALFNAIAEHAPFAVVRTSCFKNGFESAAFPEYDGAPFRRTRFGLGSAIDERFLSNKARFAVAEGDAGELVIENAYLPDAERQRMSGAAFRDVIKAIPDGAEEPGCDTEDEFVSGCRRLFESDSGSEGLIAFAREKGWIR